MPIGVVLAGGQSRRFGQDKALFKPQDSKLTNVEIAAQRFKNICPLVFVVTNPQNLNSIRSLFQNQSQVNVIKDASFCQGEGPLAGILTVGLRGHQDLLITACDYPYLKKEALLLLKRYPNTFLQGEKSHYCLAHLLLKTTALRKYLAGGQRSLGHYLKKENKCQPLFYKGSWPELENCNFQRKNMKNKNDMSNSDFQKLIALVLNDLTIRRTLLENRESEVNQEMRSLEKDRELQELDNQVQAVQADFDHYHEFQNPNFKIDLDHYYHGMQ